MDSMRITTFAPGIVEEMEEQFEDLHRITCDHCEHKFNSDEVEEFHVGNKKFICGKCRGELG